MQSLAIIAIVLLALSTALADPPREHCFSGRLDLVLVVDVSGSDENRFNGNRDAAWELARSLTISWEKAIIAVIQFSKLAIMKLEFGTSETWEVLNDTISNLEWTGDVSLTAEAMDLAMIQFRRGRPDAQRAIVLISDGNSFNTWQQVLDTSERLKYSSAKIYAISMNGNSYDTELHQYVDYSNGSIIKRQSEFQQLKGELKEMTEPRCVKLTTPAQDILRPAENNPDNVDIELPTRHTTRRSRVTRPRTTTTTAATATGRGPFADANFPGAAIMEAPIDKVN